MRRSLILLFFCLSGLGLLACSGASSTRSTGGTTPPNAASGDTCPMLDPGPPPICPEGCTWNGAACRKKEGAPVFETQDAGPAEEQAVAR